MRENDQGAIFVTNYSKNKGAIRIEKNCAFKKERRKKFKLGLGFYSIIVVGIYFFFKR